MVLTRRIRPIQGMMLAASAVLLAALVAGLWPAIAGPTWADSSPPTMGALRAAEGNGCGPATLYCICRLDGKDHSLKRLRELAKTSSSGTTMLNLKSAAERVGYHVEARNGRWRDLQQHARDLRSYAILHTINGEGGHFVGAMGAPSEHMIQIADMARGVAVFDEKSFRTTYQWEGNMLLLRNSDELSQGERP